MLCIIHHTLLITFNFINFSLLPGECMWLHLDLTKNVMRYNRKIFPVVSYAFTSTPAYPAGTVGFVLSSLNPVSGRGVGKTERVEKEAQKVCGR